MVNDTGCLVYIFEVVLQKKVIFMQIRSYRDLDIWQRARTITVKAYSLTKSFPKEETYGMVSQIRRAAASLPANIAEGWGRHYPAEFIQFLRTANGSRAELETHLILCVDIGLCREGDIQEILADTTILGKQLLAMERSLKSQAKP